MNSGPGSGRERRYDRRADRPPGWAETFLAGRSRADKEAEADMRLKAMLLLGIVAVLLVAGLNVAFSLVDLRLGWWSVPVFVPVFAWGLISAVADRVLRPVELEVWRWSARFKAAGVLLVALWVCWRVWEGPVARAWKAAHGGFNVRSGLGPRFPLHAILAASPVLTGLVAFLVLGLGMVLAPNLRRSERQPPRPPGGPEPLHAPLLSEHRPPLPRHWP